MILPGKNLIISAGGSVLAASKSCSLDVDVDTIKVSSLTNGEWEHSIAGRKSWKISTNHLVTQGIRKPVSMLGNQYTLAVGIASGIGLPFDGFVSNVALQQRSYGGTPDAIFFDTVRKLFVGRVALLYYMNWSNNKYLSASDGELFCYNDTVYSLSDGDLSEEILQGTAICKSFRIQASVGNLCQGAFSWQGTGPLE